jgi:coenzyme F420-0:L-glutamate ligase
LQVFGIKMPLIRRGDDLVSLTIENSKKQGNPIRDKDIIIFSAKVVGASQGRLIDLSKVRPSKKALAISKKYHLDPAFAEVVIKESDEILGGVEYALSTMKNGVLIANGGVDQSNSPKGFATLWPKDPQKSAEDLRRRFKDAGLDVGILIIDSRTLPLRMGNSAVALGVAGFAPVEDLRGKKDLYGRPMKIKRMAIADDLAAAAHLVMGETSESIPVAVVREAPVRYEETHIINETFIPIDQCLIMHLLRK